MTGLDVEAVLRDHDGFGITDAGVKHAYECVCRHPLGANGNHYRGALIDEHRAHVAAVLRMEIESALGDAWDAGWDRHCPDPSRHQLRATNPYREGEGQ